MAVVTLKRTTVFKSGCDMFDQMVVLPYVGTSVRDGRWMAILLKDPWYIFTLLGQPSLVAVRWGLLAFGLNCKAIFSRQLMDVFGKEVVREKDIFLIWLGIFLRILKIIFHVGLIEWCDMFWTIMTKVAPKVWQWRSLYFHEALQIV